MPCSDLSKYLYIKLASVCSVKESKSIKMAMGDPVAYIRTLHQCPAMRYVIRGDKSRMWSG